MLQDFDATRVQPQQGMDKHPVGMFDFQINNTYLAPSKDNTYLMLMVVLASPVGQITRNYIVDAEPMSADAAKTIEIANKQLSALCHAVNIHRITYPKHQNGQPIFDQAARELRGGRGRMEVAYQKGQEPSAENPAGGYVEVRKVFDSQGNEPGKQSGAPQVQQAQQQQQGQPQQAWGGQPTQQPTQQPVNPAQAQQPTWGGAAPQQQAPANNAVGWQPGPNATGAPATNPPWGK